MANNHHLHIWVRAADVRQEGREVIITGEGRMTARFQADRVLTCMRQAG